MKLVKLQNTATTLYLLKICRPILTRGLSTNQNVQQQHKKLVILGTGWGSYSVLKNVDKKLYDVVVVSPRNHFLFTPLLCSTTVGTLEFRSIIEPVRNTRFRHSEDYHFSSAAELDIQNKILTCKSEVDESHRYDITYDHLVIGVGAVSQTYGVPGVLEHAFFLKEIKDARNIRTRMIDNFELACQPGSSSEDQDRLLHIVIVGGGPTGVEFGAEVYDFLQADVRSLYGDLTDKVKVTLIEANQILSSFDKRLQQYAEKKISKRKQFELVQGSVKEVTPTHVVLNDGTQISCGLVVWSTGLAPRNFTKQLTLKKNNLGQIVTDPFLRVLDTPKDSVFALGDCAQIEGQMLQSTAQVAEKKGRWLAKYLNGKTNEEFKFQNAGMLAYVGGYKALTDLHVPNTKADIKLSGFHSWLLWRSAYLTRLGSWKLRMQVPVDWFKAFIFGRDTSQF